MSVVEVRDLRVELSDSGNFIIDSVDFSIDEGEIVGLVGETGSGKTTLGLAMLGSARRGARIAKGTVRIGGREVVPAPREGLQSARGKLIAYMPQDPSAALNPAMRIGAQVEETLAAHEIGDTKLERARRLQQTLTEVELPANDEFLQRFPHQLSGGQQQRVCLAIAICCKPEVLVLDEPTTGLDVTTQANVLASLADVIRARHMAALYVTHDLAVVSNLADRVMVLYSGRVAETGSRAAVFNQPSHPYTSKLLNAIPDMKDRRVLELIPGQAPTPDRRPSGCSFAPRCPVAMEACLEEDPPPIEVGAGHYARCLRANESLEVVTGKMMPTRVSRPVSNPVLKVAGVSASFGSLQVVRSVSFELQRGECLALVGETGSGKTTLARSIVGLTRTRTGEVSFQGQQLPVRVRDYPATTRRALQYIFQSPYTSLNPRRPIHAILATPIQHFFDLNRTDVTARMRSVLERVSLSPRVLGCYPDQLSGGERQRVAIARALVCEPEVLICDEITSALDVSVQAAIIRLLADLQADDDLGLLFVTHNMALVRTLADRVMVMNNGQVVEAGETDTLLDRPHERYTAKLVTDTPSLDRLRKSEGDMAGKSMNGSTQGPLSLQQVADDGGLN